MCNNVEILGWNPHFGNCHEVVIWRLINRDQFNSINGPFFSTPNQIRPSQNGRLHSHLPNKFLFMTSFSTHQIFFFLKLIRNPYLINVERDTIYFLETSISNHVKHCESRILISPKFTKQISILRPTNFMNRRSFH